MNSNNHPSALESIQQELERLRKENADLKFWLKQIAAGNCHDPVAFAQARINFPTQA